VGGVSSTEVSVTKDKNPHPELTGLQKAQSKARQDEIFGGLSHAEQAEYNSRAKHIHELDTQLTDQNTIQKKDETK
jgi:hypothetical protein